jgi:DNA-binding CsgD family transcriptional regulator
LSARDANVGDDPTPRETQVAIALLFGHSVGETAAELGMRPATVSCHRERLYLKYGVERASELAAILMHQPRSPT